MSKYSAITRHSMPQQALWADAHGVFACAGAAGLTAQENAVNSRPARCIDPEEGSPPGG